jgi:hypothetical protein
VPEVRSVLLAIAEPDEQKRAFRLGWSVLRRTHQAVAARCKKASHAAKRALGREEGRSQHGGKLKTTTLSPEGDPLTDAQCEMIEPLIPQKPPAGRPYHDHRKVLGGILWVARTGSSWREMPEEYGKWERAYRRYELWLKQGLWRRILEALDENPLPGPATSKPN